MAAMAAAATAASSPNAADKIIFDDIPLKGHEAPCLEATFRIRDEDHTVANALRAALLNDPDVTFAAYSMPRPPERTVHFRVACHDPKAAVERALARLSATVVTLQTDFRRALEHYHRTKKK